MFLHTSQSALTPTHRDSPGAALGFVSLMAEDASCSAIGHPVRTSVFLHLQTQRSALRNPSVSADTSLADLDLEIGYQNWAAVPRLELDGFVAVPDPDEPAQSSAPEPDTAAQDPPAKDESPNRNAKNELSELENLQVQSVYSLIEQVKVDDDTKSVLYLTNLQAKAFEKKPIQRVLDAMQIKTPRFVINLSLNSFASDYRNKSCAYGSQVPFSGPSKGRTSTVTSHHNHGELNVTDLIAFERRMTVFIQRCILPVAAETQALILLHTDNDVFTSCFAKACNLFSKSVGGDLPFTVITFAPSVWVGAACTVEGTVAHQIVTQSKRWGSKLPAILKAMGLSLDKGNGTRLDNSKKRLSRVTFQDLPRCCTHYVIVESLNMSKSIASEDSGPLTDLKDSFVQRLTTENPSIAIGTAMAFDLEWLINYVARGLPLLLLDSRPPPRDGRYGRSLHEAEEDLAELNKRLVASGTFNMYTSSTLAHLHQVLNKPDATPDSKTIQVDQDNSIHAVIAEEKRVRAEAENLGDGPDAHGQDKIMRALSIFAKTNTVNRKVFGEWGLRLMQSQLVSLHEVRDVEQLNTWLLELCVAWQYDFQAFDPYGPYSLIKGSHRITRGVDSSRFLSLKWGMQREKRLVDILWVNPDQAQKRDVDIGGMQAALASTLEDGIQKLHEIVYVEHTPNDIRHDTQVQLRDMLSSENVFSGNLSNLDALQRKITQLAKLNKLPSNNSFQAMNILRKCWDSVDIYTHEAARSKLLSKLAYFVMLLIGAANVLVIALNANNPLYMPDTERAAVILILSLSAAVIAGVTAYMDPGQRWMNLRGAALSLESDIWKFRTRTGRYSQLGAGGTVDPRLADTQLQQMLDEMERHIGKAGSVSETSFYAKFVVFGGPKSTIKELAHGQYDGCAMSGTFGTSNENDDHHTPCTAPAYLEMRVQPLVQYYQSKLPLYYRRRTTSEVLLLLISLAGTLFTFLKIDQWTGVASAVGAAITAWSAFSDTRSKLTRYSNTVEKIKSVMLWWDSLTTVAQANAGNISELVTRCEDLFEREREAWSSTSMIDSTVGNTEAVEDEAASEAAKSSDYAQSNI